MRRDERNERNERERMNALFVKIKAETDHDDFVQLVKEFNVVLDGKEKRLAVPSAQLGDGEDGRSRWRV